jgi:hypothetical protein
VSTIWGKTKGAFAGILRVFCEYSAGIICLRLVRGLSLELCVFGVKMKGTGNEERALKREKVQINAYLDYIEAPVGFEPTNKGFADLRLKPLGYSAL